MKHRQHGSVEERRSTSGYTLVEVLCVVAIGALLFAVVLPVYASAKQRAKTTRDMSDLHQLGIAGALYHDESGHWPLDTPQLVDARLVTKDLVASIQDSSARGQANDFASRYPKEYPKLRQGPTPYRRTYMGLWDYALAYDEFQKKIEEQPAAGWLVDMVGLNAESPSPFQSRPETGSYLRLTLDGAVVSRPYRWVRNAAGEEVHSAEMLYADGDPKWIESLFP